MERCCEAAIINPYTYMQHGKFYLVRNRIVLHLLLSKRLGNLKVIQLVRLPRTISIMGVCVHNLQSSKVQRLIYNDTIQSIHAYAKHKREKRSCQNHRTACYGNAFLIMQVKQLQVLRGDRQTRMKKLRGNVVELRDTRQQTLWQPFCHTTREMWD